MAINFNFTSAPCTIFGEGALKKASPYFNRFGKKALIVTGKIITKSGLTSQVQNMLSELGIESVVFNDLPGEPDDIMINNGIKVYKDEECDFIIGLGGGTPLDSAKAITAMIDMICVDAVKHIFENIKLVVENPQNKSAREQMSLAAYEAGICINNSSVTLVHGMSRPIGALFHVPHGISNAMLLVECLRFALDGAKERFADLGRAIGAVSYSDDDDKASVSFLYALQDLTMALKIPSLREYGIDLKKFENSEEKMAQDAIASGSPGNTCKVVTKEDIVSIYEILRKK